MKKIFSLYMLFIATFSYATTYDYVKWADNDIKVKRYAQSAKWYGKACTEQKKVDMCLKVANMYSDGKNLTIDNSKISYYYEQAANIYYKELNDSFKGREFYEKSIQKDTNSGNVYYNLAYMYENGIGGKPDIGKVINYYNIGCEKQNQKACSKLATMEKNGEKTKTFKQYKSECDFGDSKSCIELAKIYLEGKRVKKNEPRAFLAIFSSCMLDNSKGCFLQARFYEQGRGIPKSLEKANTAYEKACDLGDIRACNKIKQKTYLELNPIEETTVEIIGEIIGHALGKALGKALFGD